MNLHRPIRTTVLATLLALAAAALAGQVIQLKVTAEIANIRQKPSISSLIVRQIPEGGLLQASRKEGEWYLVSLEPDEIGTTAGYVHESLVLPLGESPTPPAKKKRIVEQVAPPRPKPAEAETVAPPDRAVTPRRDEPAAREPEYEPAPAAASGDDDMRPSIVLSAGLLSMAVGDLNDGAQGLADYYGFQLEASADGTIAPLRWTFPFEGEVRIPLGSGFAVTAGGGYAGSSKLSSIAYAKTGQVNTFDTTPGFSIIPIKAGILFSPVPYFYAKAGFMVVRASTSYAYHFVHESFWQDWTGEAAAFGFGAFGALGVELSLGPSFAFVVEAGGQIGKVTGFKGTGTYYDSTMTAAAEQTGTLYAYEVKASSRDAFWLLFLRDKKPTEGGVYGAREAGLDLLGLTLKAGLKLKF